MDDPTDLRRLVIAMAAAQWREDEAGLAALRYGGDGPVDDRRLLEVALEVIGERAAAEGAELVPSVGADEVLRGWALEAAD